MGGKFKVDDCILLTGRFTLWGIMKNTAYMKILLKIKLKGISSYFLRQKEGFNKVIYTDEQLII